MAANGDLRPWRSCQLWDVVDYLMGEQYGDALLPVSHAKPDLTIGAPSIPSPEKLLAYAQLVRIWREIALRILGQDPWVEVLHLCRLS